MAGIRAQRRLARPGEILDAALEEFVLKGYAGTRLEDVAARAGVTKGTIYFYFSSKERVFESVVSELSKAPILEFEQAEAAWTEDLASDIEGFLKRLYRYLAENARSREILRLLIAEANRFPALVDRHFEEFMRPCVERLRERFADAIATGDLAPATISELPEVVLGPVLALNVMMLLFANRRPLNPDGYMATHQAVLLDGILARRAPPPDTPAPGAWTAWRRFPDPRRCEALTAPLGPGLYELRLASGEPILFGAARSVANHLSTLLPAGIGTPTQGSSSRRGFLVSHLAALTYRTLASESYDEAVDLAATMDEHAYRFGRTG